MKKSPISRQLYQLHIELEGISPSIWRRLLVPSNITLEQLHLIIQVTMGWQNCHYHVFQTKDKCCFTEPGALEEGFDNWFDETDVALSDVLHSKAKQLSYEYDFGDSWDHRITLEKTLPLIGDQHVDMLCLAGENACPPEDCGGIPGYENLLEVLQDPAHPDYQELLAWLDDLDFDPTVFIIETRNVRLQMMLDYSPLLIHDEIYANFLSSKNELDNLLSSVSKQDDWQRQAMIDQFLMDSLEEEIASSGELPMTPDQLHQLLYNPFEAANVISFNPSVATVKNAPILAIFKILAEAAQHKGIKLTQRENLPLKVTRQMVDAIPSRLSHGSFGWSSSIRSEEDVYPVHITRILAILSGLCRIQKGTLLLTAKGRKILEKGQWDVCFHELMKAAFTQFNWAYLDGYPELSMIRSTSWMMLYLLDQPDLEMPSDVAAEAVLTVFPMLVDEIPAHELHYATAEETVINAMSHRWLTLLGLIGLIEYSERHNQQSIRDGYNIKLSELGRDYLVWMIAPES
ncbi:plasmid pRiA4b ORF-3 family protein [Nitrincola iocasae]|uniref:Plasmid pRiA4b ORF-3 family protein n=1 Tax=Nitrincola iocasae TaxID=2614693 RepID=A0A5J6LDA9_9GAMM|nr:plasmid pRiA4b ORF-3 family protein [Nitrincola iocasae]QEW06318.1 plasmid pRiA4b ORF-3 family protein [Nitrincola iocasae]